METEMAQVSYISKIFPNGSKIIHLLFSTMDTWELLNMIHIIYSRI